MQEKKARKARFRQLRGSWNGVIPVTKVIPNKKHPQRKKKQALSDWEEMEAERAFKELVAEKIKMEKYE